MMQSFKEANREYKLMDLGYKGRLMTWSNKRYGYYLIEEMLYCFLGNKEWSCMLLESTIEILETWTSNHNPVLINIVEKGREVKYKKMTSYRVH